MKAKVNFFAISWVKGGKKGEVDHLLQKLFIVQRKKDLIDKNALLVEIVCQVKMGIKDEYDHKKKCQ